MPNQVLTVLDEKAVNVLLFCDCLNLSVNLFRREILLRCIFLFYRVQIIQANISNEFLQNPPGFFLCGKILFFEKVRSLFKYLCPGCHFLKKQRNLILLKVAVVKILPTFRRQRKFSVMFDKLTSTA